jgi:hypothetical protein
MILNWFRSDQEIWIKLGSNYFDSKPGTCSAAFPGAAQENCISLTGEYSAHYPKVNLNKIQRSLNRAGNQPPPRVHESAVVRVRTPEIFQGFIPKLKGQEIGALSCGIRLANGSRVRRQNVACYFLDGLQDGSCFPYGTLFNVKFLMKSEVHT